MPESLERPAIPADAQAESECHAQSDQLIVLSRRKILPSVADGTNDYGMFQHCSSCPTTDSMAVPTDPSDFQQDPRTPQLSRKAQFELCP